MERELGISLGDVDSEAQRLQPEKLKRRGPGNWPQIEKRTWNPSRPI